MEKREIGPEEAADQFGISASHEQMDNGELRFRLNSTDGSAYIRTHATSHDHDQPIGWQNAHFHKSAKETYVVQAGLMILASRAGKETLFESFLSGDVVSTRPYVPHNVYLREGTIIHTIKSGGDSTPDWYPHKDLDIQTKALSEEEAMQKALHGSADADPDPRYVPYVNMYNNLDNIIWRMPAFLTGGVTLLIGIAVGLLGGEGGSASALVWGIVLAASALIIFLGAYGLWRMRIHQNLIGNELRKMEPEGYFLLRERTKATFIMPRAPTVYIFVFFCLSAVFAFGSLSVFIGNERLHEILRIPDQSSE